MINTRLDVESGIVYQEAKGTFTWPDMLKAMASVISDERSAQCTKSLWDFTDANAALTMEEIEMDLAALQSNLSGKVKREKMAWVTSTELGKSVVEIYLSKFDWADEWRVFSDPASARAWLTE